MFWLLSVLRLSGQDVDYRFYENISLGSTATTAFSFLQDSQGVIWIGSEKGLFSYDGYSTQAHFTFGETGNIGMHCIEEADSSRFYIGTNGGLLLYNYRADTYENTGVDFNDDIRALLMRHGVLWIGSTNNLYTFRPGSGELSEVLANLPHRTVYALAIGLDDDIYIGTYNGCCRLQPETGVCETIVLPTPGNKSNLFVNSLLCDKMRNCVWIGTEGNLYRYSTRTGEVNKIEALHDNSIKTLALDKDGHLLVGTDNGLYVLSENNLPLHEVHDSRDIHSLSNNIIWTIFSDREDNIWIGTESGISLARSGSILRHVPISKITGTGEGNEISSILRDSRNEFWLGGTNGLIHLGNMESDLSQDGKDFIWYKMSDKRFPLAHNKVRDIYEDSQGTLWIATDGGISSYGRATRQFTPYNIVDSTGNYNANWAYSLFVDDSQRLWIGTCLGGIFVIDKQRLMRSGGHQYIADKTYTTDNGLPGMFVNKTIPDHDGNVWGLLYDSQDCIVEIDTKTDSVSVPLSGLFSDKENPDRIIMAADGSIWIAMSGKIMRIDPISGNHALIPVSPFDRCDILAMAEAEGKIWISTSNGLWSVDRSTLERQRHSISDQRFTAMFYDDADNKLYLGGYDGFIVTSPSALSKNKCDNPLILSALYINNVFYQSPSSIRYADHIELSHKQNNLSFDLTDLPYSAEEKNRIMYKLEGDKEWNLLPPGTNRITYNNLHHGSYCLLACRPDVDGRPSGDIFSLAIRIHPAWYSTVLAKIIYVILFIILIVWAVNFVQVRRKYHLEQLEKKRIIEQSQAAKQDYDRQLLEAKARILALTPAGAKQDASYDEIFLSKVISLIDEHISDPNLNVNALCEWTGTNSKQMYRKIKQMTGQTPVEYIKSVRIKIAAELLKQHNFSVSEVMYMVGFSNSSYFSRAFTAEFGMTPKRYKDSSKQSV